MSRYVVVVGTALILAAAVTEMSVGPARAASPAGIDPDVEAALSALYRLAPAAKTLAASATACRRAPRDSRTPCSS